MTASNDEFLEPPIAIASVVTIALMFMIPIFPTVNIAYGIVLGTFCGIAAICIYFLFVSFVVKPEPCSSLAMRIWFRLFVLVCAGSCLFIMYEIGVSSRY